MKSILFGLLNDHSIKEKFLKEGEVTENAIAFYGYGTNKEIMEVNNNLLFISITALSKNPIDTLLSIQEQYIGLIKDLRHYIVESRCWNPCRCFEQGELGHQPGAQVCLSR